MDLREMIKTQTDISLELTKHVMLKEAKQSNLVFSPLSIHVVLSLIAAGAKDETLKQLLSYLRSTTSGDLNAFASELVGLVLADGSPIGGPKVSFANGIWMEKSLPIKPSFKEIVDSVYKAASKQVDFQTKAVEVSTEVNSWAEKETGGLIKEVLPSGSVDSSTRLIFANALYFKGAWNEKFESSQTKESDFHLLDGTSVKVPFMTSQKKQLLSEYDGFKVLRRPYKQGEDKRRFSMYFFLPDAKDGLQALEEKVVSEPGFLDNHLPHQDITPGEFKLPKFKVSFGFEAAQVLKGLGLVSPFSGGLNEMVDSPMGGNLYVSNIYHKSFIEVNEEGTEAAAASAAVIMMRSMPVTVDFVADHPFMFLIREDLTGVVMFVAHAVEVSSEVNSWAEKETNGLIKEVLPSGSVDSSTRLIFANALYFKGSWTEKLDSSQTKESDFHLLDGTTTKVPFMTSQNKQLLSEYNGFKVLRRPYKQGEDKRRFSMYFILPDAKDGLQALQERIGSEPGFLDNHLPHQDITPGEFKIPKFKISFGFEAAQVLKELGLVSPFSGGLSEMVDDPVGQKLYVSSIFHKSFIEVNEEGTEAAAASAGVIKLRGMPVVVDFVADHPFVFLIREDLTGVVVFVGHVLNPALVN